MDVDEKRDRSVSVLSQQQQQNQQQQAQAGPSGRRVTRGPYRRPGQGGSSTGISETLEPDGGLPGSKDGLGAFPPGSDWAKTVLALKLKSTILSILAMISFIFTSLLLEKRYKTKKERLRMERDGPPLLADGSLDYTESEPFLQKRRMVLTCPRLLVEDPFSVLSFFVPEPQTRPHLVPLYPPLGSSSSLPPSTPISTSISTSSDVPHPRAFPSTTALPLDYTPAALPLDYNPQETQKKTPTAPPSRRRHWTITRNATSRQKGKEKEDDHIDSFGGGGGSGGFGVEVPAWQVAREAHAVDFGCFALLGAELEAEMRRRRLGVGVNGTTGVFDAGEKGEEDVLLGLVRSSLDCSQAARNVGGGEDGATAAQTMAPTPAPTFKTARTGANLLASAYWTIQRAAEAEDYIRDVVYGGVDGLAYVRSLAEFVDCRCLHRVRVFFRRQREFDFHKSLPEFRYCTKVFCLL